MSEFATTFRIKEHYDKYYNGKSGWRSLCAIAKASNIVELCKAVPHNKILDIGSGEGAVLEKLSELEFGDEYYSLEISKSGVDAIKTRGIPSLAECRLFDGYEVPYDDKEFDLAILCHVLEHVEYPRKILQEAGRVAKHVIVEVPIELHHRLSKNYTWNKLGHINFYNPKSLRYLLQTVNYKVVSEKITNFSLPVYKYSFGIKGYFFYIIKEIPLRLVPRLATHIFTYHETILCDTKNL
jgi:ubiquinone/menaquinone biosynthesis C-methylase UbiE